MNHVTLIGVVSDEPFFRRIAGGKEVVSFRLATEETFWVCGEKRVHYEWHEVIGWGPVAVQCQEELCKGSLVNVTGALRTRVVKLSDNGNRRNRITEVKIGEIRCLHGGRDGCGGVRIPSGLEGGTSAADTSGDESDGSRERRVRG